ncbi:MAG: zinc-dependent peptidase [Planctomycetes bacterium]|nr:zinc-dependent peptidase [Planctomycetota bacterium]
MMHWRVALSLTIVLAGASVAAQADASVGSAPDAAAPAAIARSTHAIAGWQVLVDARLFAAERQATERALELLAQMLAEIVRVVPAPAVAGLRDVPLYVSPAYPGQRSGAEYHPSAGWLRDHGRDPAMARCVEFSGVADFEQEMQRMPNFALHELAHAYHDRALPRGFANPAVMRAYEQAKAAGGYARVERRHGPNQPTTLEPAYALTNAMEYFAEGTEAFFARNDFAPFTRDELQRHDPALHALLAAVWGDAGGRADVDANTALADRIGDGATDWSTTAWTLGGALVALLFAKAAMRRRMPSG